MQVMPRLPRNSKLGHIAEKAPKTQMVKVNVGPDITALPIRLSHYQLSQVSFHKVSEMKNRNHAEPVLIKIFTAQLNASIVLEEVNAQISK